MVFTACASILRQVLSLFPELLHLLPFSSINRCLLASKEIHHKIQSNGTLAVFSVASFKLTISEISERCRHMREETTRHRLKQCMQYFFGEFEDADQFTQKILGYGRAKLLLRSGVPQILLSTYMEGLNLRPDERVGTCPSLLYNCVVHHQHDLLKYILQQQHFSINVHSLLHFVCAHMDVIRPCRTCFEIIVEHLSGQGVVHGSMLSFSPTRLQSFVDHLAKSCEHFTSALPVLALLDNWELKFVHDILAGNITRRTQERDLILHEVEKDLKAIDRSVRCKLIHKKNRDNTTNCKKITKIGKSRTSRRRNKAMKEVAVLDDLVSTFTAFINK